MPAKTVKDLIEFNSNVSKEMKVKVLLESKKVDNSSRLIAAFVFQDSKERVYQEDPMREQYYGISFQNQPTEKGTEDAIGRLEEPTNKPMFPWGQVSCKSNSKKDEYKCNNAWFIGLAEVAKGYGPMLYDCLIARLNEEGFGLTADRDLVSYPAARVWSEYLASRPDVRKEKFDLDRSSPTSDDDCYATHEGDPQWNTWVDEPEKRKFKTEEEYKKELEKRKLMRIAVNYAYFDNGITTLNELKQAGLLIDRTGFLDESYLIKSLYESFLRDLKL